MNTNQQTDIKNTNENWTQRYVDYDKEEPQPRDISNDYIKEEMVGNVRGVFIKTRNLEPNEVESSNAGSTQNTSSGSFQGSGSSSFTGNVSGWSSGGDIKGFSGLSGSSGLSTGSDKGFSGVQDQTSFGQISSDRSSTSQSGNWSDKNVTDMPPRSDVSQKNFNDTLIGKDNFGQGGNIGNSLSEQSTSSKNLSDQRTGLSGSLTTDVNKNIAGAAANDKNLVK